MVFHTLHKHMPILLVIIIVVVLSIAIVVREDFTGSIDLNNYSITGPAISSCSTCGKH
jgi:hypothetical protein